MKLGLQSIRLDGGTQSRASLDERVIDEYSEAMREGAAFPPVVVFHDGSDYWLADGFHRVRAAERAGLGELDADVRQGGRRDAVLFSVGANASHGLRRTNEDKRRAVRVLLEDAEWSTWSDREIARRAGVSDRFVSSLRLSANGSQIGPRKVERGGVAYEMQTANIGAKKADAAPPAPAAAPLADPVHPAKPSQVPPEERAEASAQLAPSPSKLTAEERERLRAMARGEPEPDRLPGILKAIDQALEILADESSAPSWRIEDATKVLTAARKGGVR